MGYVSKMFLTLTKYELKPKSRIMDLGSQDIVLNSANEVAEVNSFITKYDGDLLKTDLKTPIKLEAKEIFERAGHTYFCCDVDERPGTIKIDLCKMVFPSHMRSSMDLVVNSGTTEHLSNVISAFALMHYITKTGGLMFHYVPLFGFGNHGLINPTPKFWHALIWMNSYEVVLSKTEICIESEIDKGNFYHDYLSYMQGLDKIKDCTWLVIFILKKNTERIFIPPYDAEVPESGLAELLLGSFHPFLCTGAYSFDEVISGINDFLEMLSSPYRLKRETVSRVYQNNHTNLGSQNRVSYLNVKNRSALQLWKRLRKYLARMF